MALKYNNEQHKQYLKMTYSIGLFWLKIFGDDKDFYSAAYWDLLTNIWNESDPVRKTDALRFMTAVKSAHTAGKYIDFALKRGILVETDNPEDARSKLLSLSPQMRERMDAFFDDAVGQVRMTNRTIDQLGPSPDNP